MTSFLITVHGYQNTSSEIFQHTIVVDNPSLIAEDAADVAEHAWTCWETATDATFLGYFSTTCIWQGARAAAILDLEAGTLAAAGTFADTRAGTASATGQLPFQCAIAVSLKGGNRPNGTPIRGRFYLPAPVSAVVPNGFLGATQRQHIANRMKVFHDELDTFSPALDPVVWSRSLGNTTSITEIRVGSVIDTIRSRRNAFTETYAVAV